jgi:hypothetical protein
MSFLVTNTFGIEYELSNNLNKEDIRDLINDFYDFSPWDRRVIKITDYQQTNDNDYWHIKHDSTCGPLGKYFDNGWEIASFIGRGISDLQHIVAAGEHLRQYGAQVNDNCGLHIHFGASNITENQMGVILAYWIKLEKILSQMVPERRRNSIHCKLLRNSVFLQKSYTAAGLWDALRPTNFIPYENDQRRFSLNLVNYAQALIEPAFSRKTVEFRLPEGTLSKFNVINWFYFLQTVINKSKNMPMPPTLRSFSLKQFLDFLDYEKFAKESNNCNNFKFEFFIWMLGRILLHTNCEKLRSEVKKYIKFSNVFC